MPEQEIEELERKFSIALDAVMAIKKMLPKLDPEHPNRFSDVEYRLGLIYKDLRAIRNSIPVQ